MSKVMKYSILIVLIVVFIGGGVFLYLKKDGYQIIFNSNGGSRVETITTGLLNTIDKPDDPTKEGYTFAGWYLNDEKFSFDTKLRENITLTAHWEEEEVPTYTLRFDALGGSEIEDMTVQEGSILEDVPVPEKEGYLFTSWYYHNKEFDFSKEISSNMTFVAKYEKDSDVVRVRIRYNNGSEDLEKKIKVGSVLTKLDEPSREGYKFVGWYLGDEEYHFTESISKDITLEARWEEIE